MIQTDMDQDNWLLEDDALLAAKEHFEKIFGNDDFCAVLVEADNIFTPEVLTGIQKLGAELVEKVPFADDVVSLTDFEFTFGTQEGIEIIDLVPEPVPTSPEELAKIKTMAMSKPALKNKIVSEDGRYAWIALRMRLIPDKWAENNSEENPEMAVGRIFKEVVGQEKYRFLNPKTTGLPVINIDKRAFLARETPKLFGISIILTILILAVSLRSATGVVFPLLTAVSAIVIVFGFQGFLGIVFDPSMTFIPVFLSLAVSIGYSIHIFNFFEREFPKNGQRRNTLLHAIEETGWPLLFSALTTIVALLSFLLVPIRPIRWIGVSAACLVGVTYILVIVLLPSLLSFGKDRKPHAVYTPKSGRLIERWMDKLGNKVLLRPKTTITLFILIVAICLIGITKFEVSFDYVRTMGLRIPYIARLNYIGNTPVGSIYAYDVAIEFPDPEAARDPENLKKFDRLVAEVKAFPMTKKVSSLLDIVKDLNQVVNDGDPSFYRIPDNREMIAQLLLLYENTGGVEVEKWVDYDYQRLRLMVEIANPDSKEINRELRLIRERSKECFPDAKVLFIGSISQFAVMMDYVTWGQVRSFLTSLVLIGILMSIVFGSIKTGLIAMIPNIAPALVVGGIMGFANIPLDIMTVTIMPMLLGLAVDDTIHFINHSQLEYSRTGSYAESTRRVFSTVGVALFLTSMVLTLNFSAYLASLAKVYVSMGILIPAGILAALAADYFVTPVLLNYFRPFPRKAQEGAGKPERQVVTAPEFPDDTTT
ncbi:efflux RND transporter permease subunit [Desulfobacter vibrioformis]|uniref:efflux RND transporter permease subunit n=1 Tax=Desulfobacter vibrioformis TaxID=34031 RepID=UPI00146FEAF8|nr:MMPL family transporter [Desulfobacter vibrioformis]